MSSSAPSARKREEVTRVSADLDKTRLALEVAKEEIADAREHVRGLDQELAKTRAMLEKARGKWGEDRASLERARKALADAAARDRRGRSAAHRSRLALDARLELGPEEGRRLLLFDKKASNRARTKRAEWTRPRPRTPVDVAEHAAEAAPDMAPIVGTSLRRLRKERALSLEALARASGVSRAMLGQVELGQSAPTISVLWKIARALGVPFSTLISTRDPGRHGRDARGPPSRCSTSPRRFYRRGEHDNARAERRAGQRIEFYELRRSPRAPSKTRARTRRARSSDLVVARGAIDLDVAGERHRLDSARTPILFGLGRASPRTRTRARPKR